MNAKTDKAKTIEQEASDIIDGAMVHDEQEKTGMELVPKDEEKPQPGGIIQHQSQPNESGPDKLLSIIDRVSGSGLTSENMDQVERLFTMHKELLDREAEAAFNDALSMAQQEIESVAVNKDSDKGKYADLNAIHAVAKPIWTKHGLSVLTKSKPSTTPGCVTVFGELRHSGGHKEPFSNDWPLDDKTLTGKDNKTPIQALGSTITYARRYTELMLFDVAIQGEDKNGAGATNELSDEASDWISKIDESSTKEELEANFKEAYKALNGDGYGRNQLIKAKDQMKKKLEKK